MGQRIVEYDETEWQNGELVFFKDGKEVDRIFADELVDDWMDEMERKGIVKYRMVV